MLGAGHLLLRAALVLGCAALLAACASSERSAPVSTLARVPAVVGSPEPAAVEQVRAAGLRPDVRPPPSAEPGRSASPCTDPRVVLQDPTPRTEQVRGTAVVLVLGCALTSPAP